MKPNFEQRCFSGEFKPEKRTVNGVTQMVIAGYAAKYNSESKEIRDYYGKYTEIIIPGFFNSVLNDDCIFCVNHDDSILLGRTSSGTLLISADNVGLKFEAVLPDTEEGRKYYEAVQRKDITGCSFRFMTEKDSWKIVDGKEIRLLVTCKRLIDVCLATWPAYDDTEASARSEKEVTVEETRRARVTERTIAQEFVTAQFNSLK